MPNNSLLRSPYILLLVGSMVTGSALAVDTPRDLRGTEVRQDTVKWEWAPVQGAVRYVITVDGSNLGPTLDTKFYSYGLSPGEHLMYVQAVDGSGNLSERTQQAKITVQSSFQSSSHGRSTLVVVADDNGNSGDPGSTPTSAGLSRVGGLSYTQFSGRDVRWQWSGVDGAAQYEVTVDGILAGTTSESQWVSENLWVGEHSLTVKAMDSSANKSVQSETLKIRVASSVGDTPATPIPDDPDNVVAPPPPQPEGGGEETTPIVQSFIDPASYNYSEVYEKEGYELAFSDEFNGTALNPYRWNTQLRWDGEWNGERYEYRVVNGEDQFYVNVLSSDEEHQSEVVPVYNPFKFDGNRLAIQAVRNPLKTSDAKRSFGSLDQMVSQQNFLSGVISTHEKFAQRFGYFEARIKIPSHVGTFPAFWLFHENRAWEGTQRTEIDIMENLGHAPQYIYNSFHYFTNVSRTYGGDANFVRPYPSGQVIANRVLGSGLDFGDDYHVYAVEWEPDGSGGKITWYIDGVQVSQLSHPEADFEELYLKINLAMGGNWTNFPANAGGLGRAGNDRFPNADDLNNFRNPWLEIDYVRAYKRK